MSEENSIVVSTIQDTVTAVTKVISVHVWISNADYELLSWHIQYVMHGNWQSVITALQANE